MADEFTLDKRNNMLTLTDLVDLVSADSLI